MKGIFLQITGMWLNFWKYVVQKLVYSPHSSWWTCERFFLFYLIGKLKFRFPFLDPSVSSNFRSWNFSCNDKLVIRFLTFFPTYCKFLHRVIFFGCGSQQWKLQKVVITKPPTAADQSQLTADIYLQRSFHPTLLLDKLYSIHNVDKLWTHE